MKIIIAHIGASFTLIGNGGEKISATSFNVDTFTVGESGEVVDENPPTRSLPTGKEVFLGLSIEALSLVVAATPQREGDFFRLTAGEALGEIPVLVPVDRSVKEKSTADWKNNQRRANAQSGRLAKFGRK